MEAESQVCAAVADREPQPGYSRACWGNHFDYQSRSWYLPKGVPTIVWTSLIGHAFLDGYAHFGGLLHCAAPAAGCVVVLRRRI